MKKFLADWPDLATVGVFGIMAFVFGKSFSMDFMYTILIWGRLVMISKAIKGEEIA
jgi:hypothetical protein